MISSIRISLTSTSIVLLLASAIMFAADLRHLISFSPISFSILVKADLVAIEGCVECSSVALSHFDVLLKES
ncbi:hypothetical protein CO641_13570 [Lysobacteraceae bacterium NML91-0213]|nr:hypothetical protein CO641_13570 [Xanthomonadaceae bacterium NML91-0213]